MITSLNKKKNKIKLNVLSPFFIFLTLSSFSFSEPLFKKNESKSFVHSNLTVRCAPEDVNEAILYTSDFKWGYTPPEMKQRFSEIYNLNKRLGKRAYYDEATQKYYLPYDDSRGGKIELSQKFINNLVAQIETALQKKYADYIFFPDMGHTHFLIPQKKYDSKYSLYPVNRFSEFYKDVFNDSEIEIFYHTAEQLKMLQEDNSVIPDQYIQWRHKTRNLNFKNQIPAVPEILQNINSPANTVQGKTGYYWWGGGFNISAHKNGCFSYNFNNQTYSFDMSLFDIGADPNSGDWNE